MSDLSLVGVVGIDFDSETVSDELDLCSGPIRINLNSGGGIASEGTAIHALLAGYLGRKTITVQGVAASAASVIMMAGDRIEMSPGSVLMIHDPSQDFTGYRGTSSEHRRIADQLDTVSSAVSKIYSAKSGKSEVEIHSIMQAETWYTPEEAVSAGFADIALEVGNPFSPAEFDYRTYAHSPTHLIQMSAQNRWENTFKQEAKMPEATHDENTTTQTPKSLAPIMAATDRVDPIKELVRVKALTALAMHDQSKRVGSMERLEGWISEGVTLNAAQVFIQNELAAIAPKTCSRSDPRDHEPLGSVNSVGMSWDHGQGLKSKMVDGVMARIDRSHAPTIGQEFASASLVELADRCLNETGQRPLLKSASARIEMALHGTSDFPEILRDVGNRVLTNSYEAAQSAIKLTSREVAASNFRALHSIKVSTGPELEEVNEAGEFKSGTIEEGAETFSVKTYGKIFGITRQAMVNDDLDVFTNMFPILGQGAANTEAKLFVQLLEENAGMGPRLADGKTLFHTDHGNLLDSSSAINVASLSAARLAMRRQKGIAGEAISVTPTFLVVPPELETEAEAVLSVISAADVGNANPFAGKLKLLVEPRLTSATAWYVCANPGAPDCLQHAYLDGASGPQIFTREGFEVDGIEYKTRMDFGAGFTDYRGWLKSPTAPE